MCPVCSVGAALALGLSRWLKVDDSISGVWIGALLLALSLWTFNWLLRKRTKQPAHFLLLLLLLAAYWWLTFLPLYAAHIISNTDCKTFWGLNRLVFGSLLGILLAAVSILIDKLLRLPGKGRALFPFQKVIIPLVILLIASLILYTIC